MGGSDTTVNQHKRISDALAIDIGLRSGLPSPWPPWPAPSDGSRRMLHLCTARLRLVRAFACPPSVLSTVRHNYLQSGEFVM